MRHLQRGIRSARPSERGGALRADCDAQQPRGYQRDFSTQLPLPAHISEEKVILAIDAAKDVDAFHPQNVGSIMTGDYEFVPCTPAGVMALLAEYGIDVSGKRAVVIGRSNIVGKPMAMLLLHKNATVTICHCKNARISRRLPGRRIFWSRRWEGSALSRKRWSSPARWSSMCGHEPKRGGEAARRCVL